MRQQPVADAGLRILLRDVAEREDIGRIEEVEIRVAVARRLREAMVEAAAARAGDVRYDAVEHLAVRLVAIEPVVEILAQEAAALRDAERSRARDRA
jgi:hypothetical protein